MVQTCGKTSEQPDFAELRNENTSNFYDVLSDFAVESRPRRTLQNETLIINIGVETAEGSPLQPLQGLSRLESFGSPWTARGATGLLGLRGPARGTAGCPSSSFSAARRICCCSRRTLSVDVPTFFLTVYRYSVLRTLPLPLVPIYQFQFQKHSTNALTSGNYLVFPAIPATFRKPAK